MHMTHFKDISTTAQFKRTFFCLEAIHRTSLINAYCQLVLQSLNIGYKIFDSVKEHVRHILCVSNHRLEGNKIFWLKALCLPNKSTRVMFIVSKGILGEPQNKTLRVHLHCTIISR